MMKIKKYRYFVHRDFINNFLSDIIYNGMFHGKSLIGGASADIFYETVYEQSMKGEYI